MIIAIILSSLALLAAIANLGLTLRTRKRSKERNTALVQYVDRSASDALKKANEKTTEALGVFRGECDRRISDLENGIVPDFEKAKVAAKAVNDFNDGISNIMGFDPFASLKQQRDGGE